MQLSNREVEFIIETLKTCKDDFEELYRTKEWFVSDSLDLIESSLEILEREKG